MNEFNGDDSARLRAMLARLGEVLFFLAVLALASVSFTTSYTGLRSIMSVAQAFLAAIGLQSALISVSILLPRSHQFHQKLLFLSALLLTGCTSIFFSYLGIRSVLSHQVAEIRAPLIEKQHFSDEQTRLQLAATSLRGRALARIEDDHATTAASLDVASAVSGVRKLEARDYEAELREIRDDQNHVATDASLTAKERAAHLARLQAQEVRDQSLLNVALAAGEKLQIDAAESRVSGENIKIVRGQLVAYEADFLTAKDWPALRASYDKLGVVWGLLPIDFQTANPLPIPPAMVILENGRPAEGFDHPIVEAVSSILTLREPLDVFSLVLAVLFDGVSMLAVFATVGEKRRFPDRLANLRRWMAATTVQLQMMPGILPWLVQSLCDFLWTSPMKADDSRIAALQQSLERLKDEMDEFLVGLPTPPSTLGTISAQLASLFARANVVSFRSSETLKNLALRMYAILSDAIESSALSDAHKEMARRFVATQGERFTSAVNDAFAN
jgi:hypothetical protein